MLKRIFALALLAALPAAAESNVVEVELLPGWREGDHHIAGLRVRLAPGWKTYWRAPGDAGIPPVFDWSASSNLDAVVVEYPAPEVFDQGDYRTIGYSGEVVLPLILRPDDSDAAIALDTGLVLGVCEDICVPVEVRLVATLPAGGAPDPTIRAARADRAEAGPTMTCRLSPIDDGLRLEVEMAAPALGSDMATVIETADPGVWVSEPEVIRRGDRLVAQADLVPPAAAPFALARDGLRVTHLGQGRAVETLGCD